MLRKMTLWIVGLLAFSTAAWAVMPPSTYLAARQSADHHVQIAVTDVDTPWRTPGVCEIEGVVSKVFRSNEDRLKPSKEVEFEVDCLKPGDEPGVGGTLWGGVSELKNARFIEVYLNGDGPTEFYVAQWQYVVIPAPTNVPVCPPTKPGLTCW